MILRVADLSLLVELRFSSRTTLACVRRNARAWFNRRGWDWSAFVRNGRPLEDFRATGDAFALALVQAVEAREAARG